MKRNDIVTKCVVEVGYFDFDFGSDVLGALAFARISVRTLKKDDASDKVSITVTFDEIPEEEELEEATQTSTEENKED